MYTTGPQLLQELKDVINLPSVDEGNPDALLYRFLTKAQQYWAGQIAVHAPNSTNVITEPLQSLGNGLYQTSRDIAGGLKLYDTTNQLPLEAGEYGQWDLDYHQEGPRTIRVTGRTPRIFVNGITARYCPVPGDISATQNPELLPVNARELIVYRAAILWALRGGERNPEPYVQLEENTAWGDRSNPASTGLVTQLKMRESIQAQYTPDRPWYHYVDIAQPY